MTSPPRSLALTLAMLSGLCVQAAPSHDRPEHPFRGGSAGALNHRAVPDGFMLDHSAALSSFESAVVNARPASLQPPRNNWGELAAGAVAFEALPPDPGAAHAPPNAEAAGTATDPNRFPEPTSLALVGSGLVGIAAARYRRRKVGR